MNIADLKGQKVMLAASGGLDSCTITHWLQSQGLEVIAYTADLGNPTRSISKTYGAGCRPVGPLR